MATLLFGTALAGCLSAEMSWDEERAVNIRSFSLAQIPGGSSVRIKVQAVTEIGECSPLDLGYQDAQAMPFAIDSASSIFINGGGGNGEIKPYLDPGCSVDFADGGPGGLELKLAPNQATFRLYAKSTRGGIFTIIAYTTAFNAPTAQGSMLITLPDPPGALTLIAGPASPRGFVNGAFAATRFNTPTGVAFDFFGSMLYVVDQGNRSLRKVDLISSQSTTFAGSNTQHGDGGQDGPATQATFRRPQGAVFVMSYQGVPDSIYVADEGAIRRVDAATGAVSTPVGIVGQRGSVEGQGSGARLNEPRQFAYDNAGGFLFVNDWGANRIVKVSIKSADYGTATTLVDTGAYGGPPQSVAYMGGYVYWNSGNAIYAIPSGGGTVNNAVAVSGTCTAMATYTSGSDYLLAFCNQVIQKWMRTSGFIVSGPTSVAGTVAVPGDANGAAAAALFSPNVAGLAMSSTASVYAADAGNHSVRNVLLSTGAVTTAAGPTNSVPTVTAVMAAPASLANTKFRYVNQVASDGTYLYYFSQGYGNVQRTNPGTTAGDPNASTNYPTAGYVPQPSAIAYDAGKLYIGGFSAGYVVRQFNLPPSAAPNATFTSNMATCALPGYPIVSIAVMGNLLYATLEDNANPANPINHIVYRCDIVAPSAYSYIGSSQGYAEGSAASARFDRPRALLALGGQIYVADTGNHVLRRIDPATSQTSLYAGTVYQGWSNGNGDPHDGPLAGATFETLDALAGGSTYLYVAEKYRNRLRRINLAQGRILTVLGGGDPGQDVLGPFGLADLAGPSALAPEAGGGLYIFNDFNLTLLK